MNKPVVRIENWDIVESNGQEILIGHVYGDPNYSNGEHIRTSVIQRMETSERIYELGKHYKKPKSPAPSNPE